MRWKIEYYDIKVMKSIRQWPVAIEAKFVKIVGLIKEFGPEGVGMPHIKALGQGLFEIRVKAAEEIGRAFFVVLKAKL